jgi:hypothetical protein
MQDTISVFIRVPPADAEAKSGCDLILGGYLKDVKAFLLVMAPKRRLIHAESNVIAVG